ncbi:MAG: DUF3343 domain-containing protein [Clostridia bacterium]|nr:DUF3343 domain-containing protein [Clostridia bacterium]
MEFGSAMMRQGVRVTAVNTPRSISSSCGLSVRFPRGAIIIAERVLAMGEYFSFKGFYAV